MIDDVLALTADLPTRTLVAGETLFVEGEESSIVVVLVDGELLVEAGGDGPPPAHDARYVRRGDRGAARATAERDRHRARAPPSFGRSGTRSSSSLEHPQLGLEVARQLAGRLDRLTAYIADVQRQVGHHDDHLGVFGELLSRIAARPPVHIEPGSDRSPDY